MIEIFLSGFTDFEDNQVNSLFGRSMSASFIEQLARLERPAGVGGELSPLAARLDQIFVPRLIAQSQQQRRDPSCWIQIYDPRDREYKLIYKFDPFDLTPGLVAASSCASDVLGLRSATAFTDGAGKYGLSPVQLMRLLFPDAIIVHFDALGSTSGRTIASGIVRKWYDPDRSYAQADVQIACDPRSSLEYARRVLHGGGYHPEQLVHSLQAIDMLPALCQSLLPPTDKEGKEPV